MLRMDRLAMVVDELARVIEATPLPLDQAPPAVAGLVKAAKIMRLDLDRVVRSMVADSTRSLPSLASADPARADAIAAWSAHLLAWLRDERDDPPPPDLPL